MESLAETIQETVQASPWLAIGIVFVGGLLTASNPCVIAVIPLSIAYVGGVAGATNWKRSLGFSLCMALGLSATFAVLGVVASLVGGAVGGSRRIWNLVIGGVCLVMGLHLMEVLKFQIPRIANVQPAARGALGALLLGVLFGLVSTPCAGPILVVLLAYLGTQGASPLYGGALLLAYGMGHCALIIVAGTSMGVARGLLESRRFARWVGVCKKLAGAIIVAVGVYFVLQAV
ncbi:MAG: cytochrome c biogenesis protein CcdA [Armatimonadota bacterium]